MYQTPIMFSYINLILINCIEFLNIVNRTSYIYALRHYYLDLNVWYFFKNIYFRNQGHYINNLNLSYLNWTINSSVQQLRPNINKHWPRIRLKKHMNFLWGIRVVTFSLKRITFNKLTFLILFLLLRFFNSFNYNINTSYSFILLTTSINFFNIL